MAAYTPRSTSSYNPYAVGDKVYGGGRSFPTAGKVDRQGYKERDAVAKARKDAILRRMKANDRGKFASADSMRRV
jgi:hypothetical protein